jgi:hypothetical protein
MAETGSLQRTPVGSGGKECFDTSAFTLPNHHVAEKQKRKKQQQAELARREAEAAADAAAPESGSIARKPPLPEG